MSQRMRRVVRIRPVLVLGAISASIFFVGLGGSAGLAAPLPTPITYVCANSSNGQLSYVTPPPKSSPSVPVTPTATQFKACYLPSSGIRARCRAARRAKTPAPEGEHDRQVPADSTSLYFCRDSGGTLHFAGTSPPSCPSGQTALVIGPHNRPPVAVADSYSTNEDTPLTVPAPGVLGNDSDPDGDPFTAGLVAGPAHWASFGLNANGSFCTRPPRTTTARIVSPTRPPIISAARASDGQSLTIEPVNDAPVAQTRACHARGYGAKAIDLERARERC